MRHFSFSEFTTEYLPDLISDKERLNAVFLTYNTVRDYDTGPVSAPNQLRVYVHNGHAPSDLTPVITGLAALAEGDHQTFHEMGDQIERDGLEGQTRLEDEFGGGDISEEDPLLFVIYVGLTAFEKSLRFANSLKSRYKKATIVVTTCDCDLNSKLQYLKQYEGIIDSVVVSRECGGRVLMREILENLIETWPH